MKTFIKIILFWLIIFGLLEILSRVLFPNYSLRSVESYENLSIIQNKKNFFKDFSESTKVKIRDSKIDNTDNKKDNLIYIIGDSVSAGYGLSYQNTFYSITEKMLNSINISTKIISFGGSGTDLNSQLKKIKKIKIPDSKKKILIYQFSYNDLTPAYLHGHGKGYEYFGPKEQSEFFKKFVVTSAKFRYKYLNKSNLLSLLQFNVGRIKYKPWEENCQKRAIYSLGELSYAFYAKGFEKDSDLVWSKYTDDLRELKDFSQKNNFELFILISPVSIQIPNHESENIYNYDLKCATKDARLNLKEILKFNNIKIIDPTDKMIKFSINTSKEKNKEKLFFDFDYGHPNEIGSRIIAEALFSEIYENIK